MAAPRPTKFTAYDFTQLELFAATRLDTLTQMLIQTLYAQAAEERLALTIDTEKTTEFVQREACLRGQMEAYEHLLFLASETAAPDAGDANKAADTQTPRS